MLHNTCYINISGFCTSQHGWACWFSYQYRLFFKRQEWHSTNVRACTCASKSADLTLGATSIGCWLEGTCTGSWRALALAANGRPPAASLLFNASRIVVVKTCRVPVRALAGACCGSHVPVDENIQNGTAAINFNLDSWVDVLNQFGHT